MRENVLNKRNRTERIPFRLKLPPKSGALYSAQGDLERVKEMY